MNLALQGSKAARSRGKVPSLHPDPKDAGFQGSRIYSRLYKGFQVFKLSGFQNSKAYHSRFFRVPWFQDVMTHETAAHVKRIPARAPANGFSKVQARGSGQGSSKGFLQRFRQRSQHRSFSKGPQHQSRKKQNPKKILKLSSYRSRRVAKQFQQSSSQTSTSQPGTVSKARNNAKAM